MSIYNQELLTEGGWLLQTVRQRSSFLPYPRIPAKGGVHEARSETRARRGEQHTLFIKTLNAEGELALNTNEENLHAATRWTHPGTALFSV